MNHMPQTFDGRCHRCGNPHLTLEARAEALDVFTHPHPVHGPMLRNRYRCPNGHVTYELGYRVHLLPEDQQGGNG